MLDILKSICTFVCENLVDILLIVVGAAGFITYFWQSKRRERESAALIVTQIEDLKDKLLLINDIAVDRTINEQAFYESLDILSDNQWEKYRHLFIKKIDSYSYRLINQFYEYALGIREQLMFVKQLQHQQYFNIQGMIDTDCNNFLLETLGYIISSPKMEELKQVVLNKEANSDNENKQKEILAGMLDELIKSNPNYDFNQFWKIYDNKKNILKTIVNASPYISYVPAQVADTLNKAIKNINSIEVLGCQGYRKLKRLSRIK